MASGFSLGAAIGATGKFPKIKAPEVDTSVSDRQARELQAIRDSLVSDKSKFHNVYIGKNEENLKKNISELLQSEKTKDPNVIEKAYNIRASILGTQNRYANLSKDLFDFETNIEINRGGKSEFYISPSMEKAYDIIKSSNSEEDMFAKFQQNPEIIADGYFDFEQTENGVSINPLFRPKVDFEKTFGGGQVFKFNESAVLMSEEIDPTTKGQVSRRYYSIPATRQEALELKKTNPNIDENNNAYEMGLSWFKGNQDAQNQYRSMLYHSTNDINVLDPNSVTTEQVYDRLFKDVVQYNIPAKYENKDYLERRTNVSVYVDNTGQKVAPTDYTVGSTTMNYMGKPNALKSDLSASVSPKAEGTTATIPTNGYIVGLNDGLPAFTTTAQKEFTISRVAIFPAVKAKHKYTDPVTKEIKQFEYLRPITGDELAEAKKNGVPYLMYPFAIANNKSLSISKAPEVGVSGYAIPLYEPDANGRWIVPKDSRKVKTTGGSPLLSQVVQKNNWDEASQKNWDNAFFSIMAGVKDQDDIKQK